jgi:hypothetical protein
MPDLGFETKWGTVVFRVFFFALVEPCFCRGFWGKAGAGRGVFVVKLW